MVKSSTCFVYGGIRLDPFAGVVQRWTMIGFIECLLPFLVKYSLLYIKMAL